MSASIYLPSRIAQHLEYHPVLGVGVMQLEPFSLWNCPAHAATLVEAPQEWEDRSHRRRLGRVLDDGLDASRVGDLAERLRGGHRAGPRAAKRALGALSPMLAVSGGC